MVSGSTTAIWCPAAGIIWTAYYNWGSAIASQPESWGSTAAGTVVQWPSPIWGSATRYAATFCCTIIIYVTAGAIHRTIQG